MLFCAKTKTVCTGCFTSPHTTTETKKHENNNQFVYIRFAPLQSTLNSRFLLHSHCCAFTQIILNLRSFTPLTELKWSENCKLLVSHSWISWYLFFKNNKLVLYREGKRCLTLWSWPVISKKAYLFSSLTLKSKKYLFENYNHILNSLPGLISLVWICATNSSLPFYPRRLDQIIITASTGLSNLWARIPFQSGSDSDQNSSKGEVFGLRVMVCDTSYLST